MFRSHNSARKKTFSAQILSFELREPLFWRHFHKGLTNVIWDNFVTLRCCHNSVIIITTEMTFLDHRQSRYEHLLANLAWCLYDPFAFQILIVLLSKTILSLKCNSFFKNSRSFPHSTFLLATSKL